MTRKILVSAVFLFMILPGFAQDSLKRKANHYLGIQANQLLRQILNFGNSTSIDNPYLFVYSINSIETGFGMNIGMGYTFNESKDGDAFNTRKTTINNLAFRVGFEKKSELSKRWLVSWGFDVVIDNQKNNTINTIDFGQGNNSTVETTSKTSAFGIGPRLTLNYKISEKIFLGTESTYYFKSGENKLTVNQSTGGNNETSDKFKRFQLAVPVVLLLILKI